MARHVRTGDKVMIIAGSDAIKGKVGTILRVDPAKEQVFVKGLNLRTKHLKPTRTSPQGGIITREAGIHLSNVMPVDKEGNPTRVRFVTKPDGSKVRVAVTTGEELSVIRTADAKKHVASRPKSSGKSAGKAPKAPAKKTTKAKA